MPRLRVLVVGSDISAKSFAAFLKMKKGDNVLIDLVAASRESFMGHGVPCTYNSMWLKNDSRGRWMATNFFRDTLQIPVEAAVSRVGSRIGIVNGIGYRETIPSWDFILKNLISFLSEPFRGSGEMHVDLHAFLKSRFGNFFAKKYSQILVGHSGINPANIPAIHVIPQTVLNQRQYGSLLLSPIKQLFSSTGGGMRTDDFLDHSWQRYITGGKYIEIPVEFESRLNDYLGFMGVQTLEGRVVPESCQLVEGKGGKISAKISTDPIPKEYDLIVTSEGPDVVSKWSSHAHQYEAPTRHAKVEVRSSNILIYPRSRDGSGRRLSPEEIQKKCEYETIFWGHKNGIIGAVIRTGLFDCPRQDSPIGITIYQDLSVENGVEDFIGYLQSAYPWMKSALGGSRVVISGTVVEEITPKISPSELFEFHEKFRIPQFRSFLQVIGDRYYPSSNLSDVLNDSKWLADRIDERYFDFPKICENEQRTDWVHRGGVASLDGSLPTSIPVVNTRIR